MTTSILTPHNTNPFGAPDSYPRAVTKMSRGQGYFFHNFNPNDSIGSTNYDFQPLQPHSTEQAFTNVWGSSSFTTAQPQDTQHAFASQAPVNTSPTSTASINPAALSAPSFTPTNASASFSTSTFTPTNSSAALSTPTFTPANPSAGFHNTNTSISPSQSHFDTNLSSSPLSNTTRLRSNSLYAQAEDDRTSPTQSAPRRRRNSEYVVPGSARAIYLEKNRRAASKCRSKQKMEQEMLVERSRDFERRNRMLRAEKEMLQGEVRALKEMLGQHAHCPDGRIAQYLQLEADRLASASGQDFTHGYTRTL